MSYKSFEIGDYTIFSIFTTVFATILVILNAFSKY